MRFSFFLNISMSIIILSSCQNKKKNIYNENTLKLETSQKVKLVEIKHCFKQEDTIQLKKFFQEIRSICVSDSTKIEKYLSANVKKHYINNLCSLLSAAYSEKEGRIEYTVLKEEEDCKGIISINSLNFYTDDEGEKYRNEYSTFFYIVKEDNRLLINEIGGAG